MKKLLRSISKLIFFIPCVFCLIHMITIIKSIFYGSMAGMPPYPDRIYGIEAVINEMVWVGLIGIIYIPFIIYQLIYLHMTKNKLYKKIFIIQFIIIILLELPLLKELILHGF